MGRRKIISWQAFYHGFAERGVFETLMLVRYPRYFAEVEPQSSIAFMCADSHPAAYLHL